MHSRVAPAALLAAGLMLAPGAAAQTTLHVDDDAPGDPGPGDTAVSDPAEDGTAAHPFDALAEAIAAADPGDTVLVHVGVYRGPGNRGLTLDEDVTIVSKRGPRSCVLDLEGLDNAFVIVLAAPTIRGLTFLNGDEGGSSGGALRILGGAAPLIDGCLFQGGFAGDGGAISVENASPDIRHCAFVGNGASNGGALAVRLGSQPRVANCTFTQNSALFGGALYTADSSSTEVLNSILWGNDGAGGSDEIHAGGDVAVAFSDVAGGRAGVIVEAGVTLDWDPSNIDADPSFAGAFGNDVHLRHDSPCIDAGDTLRVPAGAVDLDGDPAPTGADVDMGADEFRRRFYVDGPAPPGAFASFNAVGQPGDSTLVFGAVSVLDPPVPLPEGLLHLDPPLFFHLVPLGTLPASGHASFAGLVPVSLPSGLKINLQALVGGQLTGLEVFLIE